MKREVPSTVPFETAVSAMWDLMRTKGDRALCLLALLGDNPVSITVLHEAVVLEPRQVRTFLMWGAKPPLEAVDLDAAAVALGDIERECDESGVAAIVRYMSWSSVLFDALNRVLPLPGYSRDLVIALDVALEDRVQPGLAPVLLDLWAREARTGPCGWKTDFVPDLAERHGLAPGVVQDLMRRRGWWSEPTASNDGTVQNVAQMRFHVTFEDADTLPDLDG